MKRILSIISLALIWPMLAGAATFGGATIGQATIGATTAAAAAGWVPTNLTTCIGWWVMSDMVTNAGVLTVPNRYQGNTWALTNVAASSTWPTRLSANLNGLDVISFDGLSQYLRCDAVTNSQPLELDIVYNYRVASGSSAHSIVNGSAGFWGAFILGAAFTLQLNSGGGKYNCWDDKNKCVAN